MVEEKVITGGIEKLVRWKIWVERCILLISLGLFFLLGPGFFGVVSEILLSLLVIILSLLGFNFGLMSLINSYIRDFIWSIYRFYGTFGLGKLLVFLVFLGVIGWVIASIRYKHSKQEILKSNEMEEAVVESLIEHVQTKNYGEYGVVISILGDIGNKRTTLPIIQVLMDGDEEIKQKAIKALGKIGDERAVEPLTQALEDENENVRKAAKEALEKIEKKLKITEQKSGDIK